MSMNITSAYNFVPLSAKVVQPAWQDLVSHDLPLAEGLCAELELELQAHTPLLVGGSQQRANGDRPAQVDCYRLPDGRPAIPGSSVRGMLRNVLEIATFARLAPVIDDRALSLRDVSNAGNDYMRALVDGAGLDKRDVGAKPRARSGWLWFDGDQWRLEPVAHARIEQNLIKAHFGLGDKEWPRYDDAGGRRAWRLSAREKRKLLCRAVDNRRAAGKVEGDHLQVRFKLATEKTHPHSGGKWLAYHKVERLVPMEGAGTTYVEGVLVCTGQPGPVKHMEFVFLPFKRKADSYVVPPDVMAAFQQVHDAADGDWEQLWKGLAGKGSPVPVFFLGDQAAGAQRPVARLGLAQMFRLPGLHRLGELAGRAQAQAPADRLDFVQTLFGHVLDGLPALKGRVAISDFVPVADAPPREAAAGYRGATVLGQPRPGFYPNYLKQGSGQAPNGNGYATILSPQPPELRGWKRYPVRAEAQVHVPPPPEKSKPSVQVQLRPLAAGCRMRGTIRLHNVRPEELGAILWALDFGQPAAADGVPSLRHALGMGKPFGFGQVSLRLLGEPQVRPNDPRAAPPAVATLRRAFEDYMAAQVPNWGNSETLRELRAMADPSHPAATRANLTPPQGPKAFTEIKKAGVRAALTPYSQMGTRR